MLSGASVVAFLDCEGTQWSHEIIEIGAVKAVLKPDCTFKKVFKGFRVYVKAKQPVGPFVTKLTGISDSLLEKKGVRYARALEMLRKYLGADYPHCRFLTYGKQDGEMFIASGENNLDASIIESRSIAHRCLDFESFLNRFVPGKDGNPLSQKKALEVFGLAELGTAHDALDDAINLSRLFEAFVKRKYIVLEKYMHLRCSNKRGAPAPVKKFIAQLLEQGQASLEDLRRYAAEDIK